jgi:LysM domain
MTSRARKGLAFGATLQVLFCAALWAPPPVGAQGAPAPPGPITVSDQVPAQPNLPGSPIGLPPGMTFGNPQQANGTIGGGNATESSSHPLTGEEQDTFDFGKEGAGEQAAHGTGNGPIFTTRRRLPAIEHPETYVVRRGDTLWAVCDHFLSNPYQWPRVWSYNPQIKNPNWIYPGDELRLRLASAPGAAPEGKPGTDSKMSLVDRRRRVPHDSIFLRDQGWIHDASDEIWGEVAGSAAETMFLSGPNEVYLSLGSRHDPRVGQELTVFRTRESAAAGTIVQILGTVRINEWNSKERVARAQIVETLDTIERGSKIGPIERTFLVVSPVTNEAEVTAHILAGLRPNEFFGQNQLVFIDKGEAAGLRPGNRLLIRRQGDAWRHTLVTEGAGYRISPDNERPMPPMEMTPGSAADDRTFPEEVVAELRVLTTKRDSAACLVTHARKEIDNHDIAYAPKGY